MLHRVFAYGTLRDKEVLKVLLGRIPETRISSLSGFRMGSILLDGIDYPIIIEDSEAIKSIPGVYFEVEEDELEKLDIYESDAYRRIRVKLDDNVFAWVYCQ